MKIEAAWSGCRAAVIGAMVLSAATLVGCGNAGPGQATATDAETGLVMQLPSGWSQDRHGIYSQRGHRDDHHGLIYHIDLDADAVDALVGGASLEQIVERVVDFHPADVISRQRIDVAGHEAFELITAATYHLYELYMVQADRLIVVSFRALPEAFDDQLDGFRAATRSIRFQ